jgi:hypothetical protein
MQTVWDVLTVAMFAGLIVLFLQRATAKAVDPHPLWQYLAAATGCGLTDYLGNQGHALPAVLLLGATLAFVLGVLRPVTIGGPR